MAKKMTAQDVNVPADVPPDKKGEYVKNFLKATHNSGRLMLFAGDQKIEHLNDDFFGKIKVDGKEVPIPRDDADPEHLFRIASKAKIGVFASQLGLISHFGPEYNTVPYLVKLNSKSSLVKTSQSEPISAGLWSVEQVVNIKQDSGLKILGVGYTIYLGSEFEADMMSEAAQIIHEAHQNGLLSVLWIYPRGKAVPDETNPHLIAGAAGVGACLGADFVKVNYPKVNEGSPAEAFKEAVIAAGKHTRVVTAGGSSKPVKAFLQETYDQIHISGCFGSATGRNIHQKELNHAVRMANATFAVVVEDKSVGEAMKVYEGA